MISQKQCKMIKQLTGMIPRRLEDILLINFIAIGIRIFFQRSALMNFIGIKKFIQQSMSLIQTNWVSKFQMMILMDLFHQVIVDSFGNSLQLHANRINFSLLVSKFLKFQNLNKHILFQHLLVQKLKQIFQYGNISVSAHSS